MEVRLKNISKVFNSNIFAVKNISNLFESKKFTVLLGPSGCGKTTVLRMIAGLEKITEGYLFLGDNIANDIPPKKRNIAMAFQRFTMYPGMNVYQNIAFPLEIKRIEKDKIKEKIDKLAKVLKINDLLNRLPDQVSGGEAQRIALARMLVREPNICLMDEPLSSLDAKLRIELRTEIKNIHLNNPRTTIFVTHDQEEAMSLGEQIVVMDKGEIIQQGVPDEIFNNPKNVFVGTFLGLPTMNIIKCNYDDNLNVFNTNEKSFLLKCSTDVNKKYIKYIGIRPENIKLNKNKLDKYYISCKILVIENLGNKYLYTVEALNQNIKIICKDNKNIDIGQKCFLKFDDNSIYCFDNKEENLGNGN